MSELRSRSYQLNKLYFIARMGLSTCCCQGQGCLFCQQGCSGGRGYTNLQIPVNNSINVAVMDTLQDLLYAVAEGGARTKGGM